MAATWGPATYADEAETPQTCPQCGGQTEFLKDAFGDLLAERCKPCGWTIRFDEFDDDDPSVEWDDE